MPIETATTFNTVYDYPTLIHEDHRGKEGTFGARYLLSRGVSPDVADARGYRLIANPEDWVLVPGAGQTPWKAPVEFENTWYSNDYTVPLGIPVYQWNQPNIPCLVQLRPEKPITEKGEAILTPAGNPKLGPDRKPLFKMSTKKFMWPYGVVRGSGVGNIPADVNPLSGRLLANENSDNPLPLFIVEGVVKADSVLSAAIREQIEIIPVAIAGVTMLILAGSTPENPAPEAILHPEMLLDLPLKDRLIYLCFDADWTANGNVSKALLTTARLLTNEGAEVRIVNIPAATGPKAGADDYLAGGHGTLQSLLDSTVTMTDAERVTKQYTFDDIGRGKRLVDELLATQEYRFSVTSKEKMAIRWTGKRYEPDRADTVVQFASALTERAPDDKSGRSMVAVRAAVRWASSAPGMAVTDEELDAAEADYLLNTQSGTVDLLTGEIMPWNPGNRITLITPSGVDDTHPTVEWARFLEMVTGGDTELQGYLQRFAGMCAIGRVHEELIHFFYGPGNSGKSTFLEMIGAALGPYAKSVETRLLMAQGSDEEMAELKGCRFASAAELEKGSKMSDAAMKKITSRDKMSGRGLFKDRVYWPPSHSIALSTNSLPHLDKNDTGTRRRVRIVPFAFGVPSDQADHGWSARLHAELPGILAWIVSGAKAFVDAGMSLETCAAVDAELAAYLAGGDVFQEFIEDCIIIDPDFTQGYPRTHINMAYRGYMESLGIKPWSAPSVLEALIERGIMAKTGSVRSVNGTRYYRGIRLRTSSMTDPERRPSPTAVWDDLNQHWLAGPAA